MRQGNSYLVRTYQSGKQAYARLNRAHLLAAKGVSSDRSISLTDAEASWMWRNWPAVSPEPPETRAARIGYLPTMGTRTVGPPLAAWPPRRVAPLGDPGRRAGQGSPRTASAAPWRRPCAESCPRSTRAARGAVCGAPGGIYGRVFDFLAPDNVCRTRVRIDLQQSAGWRPFTRSKSSPHR